MSSATTTTTAADAFAGAAAATAAPPPSAASIQDTLKEMAAAVGFDLPTDGGAAESSGQEWVQRLAQTAKDLNASQVKQVIAETFGSASPLDASQFLQVLKETKAATEGTSAAAAAAAATSAPTSAAQGASEQPSSGGTSAAGAAPGLGGMSFDAFKDLAAANAKPEADKHSRKMRKLAILQFTAIMDKLLVALLNFIGDDVKLFQKVWEQTKLEKKTESVFMSWMVLHICNKKKFADADQQRATLGVRAYDAVIESIGNIDKLQPMHLFAIWRHAKTTDQDREHLLCFIRGLNEAAEKGFVLGMANVTSHITTRVPMELVANMMAVLREVTSSIASGQNWRDINIEDLSTKIFKDAGSPQSLASMADAVLCLKEAVASNFGGIDISQILSANPDFLEKLADIHPVAKLMLQKMGGARAIQEQIQGLHVTEIISKLTAENLESLKSIALNLKENGIKNLGGLFAAGLGYFYDDKPMSEEERAEEAAVADFF